jgi:hypothetical protein
MNRRVLVTMIPRSEGLSEEHDLLAQRFVLLGGLALHTWQGGGCSLARDLWRVQYENVLVPILALPDLERQATVDRIVKLVAEWNERAL